jgi:hypothetical protein
MQKLKGHGKKFFMEQNQLVDIEASSSLEVLNHEKYISFVCIHGKLTMECGISSLNKQNWPSS